MFSKQLSPFFGQDATRALIDTLGAVACSVGDALPSTGGSFRENAGTMLAEGGDSSFRGPVRGSAMGSEAFGLAVDELGRMCAVGKGDGVDWELLGLPLRSEKGKVGFRLFF